jgi:hypothetical protein
VGALRLPRTCSPFLQADSAMERSMRKRAPITPRASLARVGSEPSALKKYLRVWAQQFTSAKRALAYR